jgi:small ligand-binding sensory domain FIST
VLVVVIFIGLLLFGAAIGLRAQRSTATSLQWDPVGALFHAMANGVDYSVNGDVAQNCGSTVACANTILGKPIQVFGTAPFSTGSPSTITLTGLPFSSATSYVCTASDQTSAANTAIKIVNASGSSTVITGPNTITDTMGYVCQGF